MYVQIIELGQIIGQHPVTRDNEGQLTVQRSLLINWIYEVARDCKDIDEVRVYNNGDYVSFDIDRAYEPPRVNVYQVSSLTADHEEYEDAV